MGIKKLSHIRPPRVHAGSWIVFWALLTAFSGTAIAQEPVTFAFTTNSDPKPPRPQFRQWNLGLVVGFSPINGGTGMPTIKGHYRNFSAEISPYPFCAGLEGSYHFPVLTVFKKLYLNIDASLFGARQNGNYWILFPVDQHMDNLYSVGLLAGPSVYFLKRCSVQGKIGLAWGGQYGDHEFGYYTSSNHFVSEQASLSFEVRLFNTFAQ